MSDSLFEQTYEELVQKKDLGKVKWLDNMEKVILPSIRKRIQANDKSVLQEMILPKWVKWDLLRSWASEKTEQKDDQLCILCQQINPNGIHFHARFICENCFKTLRSM